MKVKSNRAVDIPMYGRNRNPKLDTILTPPSAVHKLLEYETFSGIGWEPASGTGNISKCFDPPLMSFDISIEDWVYGEKGIDFLKTNRQVDFIITNPPYAILADFVLHALECAPKVAMLLRIQVLDGKKRYESIWSKKHLRRVYVSPLRRVMACHGMNYNGPPNYFQTLAWSIFDRSFIGNPEIRWIT